MSESSSDEQFGRFLNTMLEMLNDDVTPATRGFIRGIRTRYVGLHEQGREGLNAEYLVSDLVGILSHFEVRLRALEERPEPGLGSKSTQLEPPG